MKKPSRNFQKHWERSGRMGPVRALVLTGSGSKAFVAGADISEFSSFSKEQGEQLARDGQEELFDRVENMSKVVIGAINGFALGGGLELAMSCHFRYLR